jgi:hypothetical protein
MNRLALSPVAAALLLLSNWASAATVDLVDRQGTLTWDSSVSVTSPAENTSVTHPQFSGNRHPHEKWFLYIEGPGLHRS